MTAEFPIKRGRMETRALAVANELLDVHGEATLEEISDAYLEKHGRRPGTNHQLAQMLSCNGLLRINDGVYARNGDAAVCDMVNLNGKDVLRSMDLSDLNAKLRRTDELRPWRSELMTCVTLEDEARFLEERLKRQIANIDAGKTESGGPLGWRSSIAMIVLKADLVRVQSILLDDPAVGVASVSKPPHYWLSLAIWADDEDLDVPGMWICSALEKKEYASGLKRLKANGDDAGRAWISYVAPTKDKSDKTIKS